MKKRTKKIGDILLDLEAVLDRMVDQGLQRGDVLALVNTHLTVHRPDCIEEYKDGSPSPEFYYLPKELT